MKAAVPGIDVILQNQLYKSDKSLCSTRYHNKILTFEGPANDKMLTNLNDYH